MTRTVLALLCLASTAQASPMSVLAARAHGGDGNADAPDVGCGNDVCSEGETCETCVEDCGECEPEPACPDDLCNGVETCETCEADCGECEEEPACPDAVCNGAENCTTCAADCGACGSDPLDVYPDLDLATIPWHTAAGGWGDQVALAQVVLPTTTTTAEVDTAAECTAAADTAGVAITVVGAGWSDTTCNITADDVDLIISEGVAIDAAIQVEGVDRIRIRGETPGEHSGGRVGQIRTFGSGVDLVIDGIDVNGSANYGAGESNQAFRISSWSRVAITNTRAIAGGYLFVGNNTHLYVLGSSMYHGAAARTAVGFGEGWGIRNAGGPVTIFESEIWGTRYVNVRTHSLDGAGEVLYIGDTTLVALAEGRSIWMWPNLGNNSGIGAGFIMEDSDIYAYSAGTAGEANCSYGPEGSNYQNAYSHVHDNVFHGAGHVVWDQDYLDELENGGASHTEYGPSADPPGDHDWQTGNTFDNGFSALPAWTRAGDASAVPLPDSLTLIVGECEGACNSSGLDCPGFGVTP